MGTSTQNGRTVPSSLTTSWRVHCPFGSGFPGTCMKCGAPRYLRSFSSNATVSRLAPEYHQVRPGLRHPDLNDVGGHGHAPLQTLPADESHCRKVPFPFLQFGQQCNMKLGSGCVAQDANRPASVRRDMTSASMASTHRRCVPARAQNGVIIHPVRNICQRRVGGTSSSSTLA